MCAEFLIWKSRRDHERDVGLRPVRLHVCGHGGVEDKWVIRFVFDTSAEARDLPIDYGPGATQADYCSVLKDLD